MAYIPPNPNGQASMANSSPVVIASDQLVNIMNENLTWKRNFASLANINTYWTNSTGTGMTMAATNGNLVITTGTTANSVTSLQSLQAFTLPFRLQFSLQLSQRIANQTFVVDILNADGTTYVGWQFDGTSATTGKAINQNQGNGALTSSVTVTTTATAAVFEIDCRAESADFSDYTTNSPGAKNWRRTQTDNILDPDVNYFVRIRAINGATAPASSTALTMGYVLVQDITKFVAELAGGRGNIAPGRAIPVSSGNPTAVTVPSNAYFIAGNSGGNLTGIAVLATNADASSTSQAGLVATGYNYLFNNSTWDRQRNNITAAVIAAGATTAQTSATQTNINSKKLHIVINVSAFSSGSLVFTVNAITSTGYTYPLITSAAITAAGTTILRVFPGATPSANAVANDAVPRSFNVVVSGTFSATYGVDYQLML